MKAILASIAFAATAAAAFAQTGQRPADDPLAVKPVAPHSRTIDADVIRFEDRAPGLYRRGRPVARQHGRLARAGKEGKRSRRRHRRQGRPHQAGTAMRRRRDRKEHDVADRRPWPEVAYRALDESRIEAVAIERQPDRGTRMTAPSASRGNMRQAVMWQAPAAQRIAAGRLRGTAAPACGRAAARADRGTARCRSSCLVARRRLVAVGAEQPVPPRQVEAEIAVRLARTIE